MKKKNKITTALLFLLLLAGFAILLYPSVSNYWNSFHQSQTIATYVEELANLGEDVTQQMWTAAADYNARLAAQGTSFAMTEAQRAEYASLLNISGDGMMGYIEIPSIQCYLPIYHGTDAAVLQFAVGHLEWSSLPVGGRGSHCVLSGHRGLPSAKLFTNLDQLQTGDVFTMNILNEVLAYEVDQVLIVEPEDVEALRVVPGQDYCTLVTCTPYGVNSHRLLVRGHRIATVDSRSLRVVSEAIQVDPLVVAPFAAIPFVLLLVVVVLWRGRKGRK